LTGRYQQRFGFDTIPDCPLPLAETTLPNRLQRAGYVCGMVGKWHLDPNPLSAAWIARNLPEMAGKPLSQVRIPPEARQAYSAGARGFQEYFQGELQRYWANFNLAGEPLRSSGQWVETPGRYRIDVKTEAALAFLQRHQRERFFLYLAYMAPHTPLDAPQKYLARFPGEMPTRRRYALAIGVVLAGIVAALVEIAVSRSPGFAPWVYLLLIGAGAVRPPLHGVPRA
jgi:arylsulfatase A-like enzyme